MSSSQPSLLAQDGRLSFVTALARVCADRHGEVTGPLPQVASNLEAWLENALAAIAVGLAPATATAFVSQWPDKAREVVATQARSAARRVVPRFLGTHSGQSLERSVDVLVRRTRIRLVRNLEAARDEAELFGSDPFWRKYLDLVARFLAWRFPGANRYQMREDALQWVAVRLATLGSTPAPLGPTPNCYYGYLCKTALREFLRLDRPDPVGSLEDAPEPIAPEDNPVVASEQKEAADLLTVHQNLALDRLSRPDAAKVSRYLAVGARAAAELIGCTENAVYCAVRRWNILWRDAVRHHVEVR